MKSRIKNYNSMKDINLVLCFLLALISCHVCAELQYLEAPGFVVLLLLLVFDYSRALTKD